ncbi:MAG: 7-cyano-7-deazaguanine synthase QueC [Methylococcales bacterium]|jgi:7-cyano-7-deazaguanine synthase|nr:7-cyano-7-deazaguanine synthase QueC [Methylococcales bacterium]
MVSAVILVSGGLDSTTLLSIAIDQGYQCYALSFDYGQRHRVELDAATEISRLNGVVEHKIVSLNLNAFGGSALTDNSINVPTEITTGIPVTYVPARNTIFLSYALAWAEVLGCQDIFIGVNAVDYSGYPDCRPEYVDSFAAMANLATKSAVEGDKVKIHTPLIALTKGEIIKKGISLGVDYSKTISCYQANEKGEACGVCDSCRLRRQGFQQVEVSDPTRYELKTN